MNLFEVTSLFLSLHMYTVLMDYLNNGVDTNFLEGKKERGSEFYNSDPKQTKQITSSTLIWTGINSDSRLQTRR